MRIVVHDHNGGVAAIPERLFEEIKSILLSVDVELRSYASTRLKAAVLGALRDACWSDEARLDEQSSITITSIKDEVGLCLQTGNVSRTYADMLKLQTLYARRRIAVGIIIVPTGQASKALGGNVASYERLVRELRIFRDTITMPLVILGFENEGA